MRQAIYIYNDFDDFVKVLEVVRALDMTELSNNFYLFTLNNKLYILDLVDDVIDVSFASDKFANNDVSFHTFTKCFRIEKDF